MQHQSYSTGNRIFTEAGLADVGSHVEHNLRQWKATLKAISAKWLMRSEARQRPKMFRFWIISILMAFGILTYYSSHTALIYYIPELRNLSTAPHDLFRSIFLIPIIYAALVFRVRGALIASLVFLCVILPRAFFDSPYPEPLLRALIFVIITTFVSLLVALGSNRIDKEKENTKLLQFLADCMQKQEGEKQHLAREIHDGSLQVLLDISHSIDTLSEVEDRKDVKSRLQHLRDKADTVQVGLRQLIMGLRPPILEDLGLESSLKWLANEIAEENSIEVNVEICGEASRLADSIELSLFRIAQEALQNAKKHSLATKIQMTLSFIREKVYLTIQDNGVGFSVLSQDKLAVRKKFGLIGMTERARLVDGNLRIESSEGNGTTILVEVPARRAECNSMVFG